MKTKPIILAIVGESGSGKTHIANWLGDHGYCHTIVSPTTRPMRENETDGRDHVFVSEESGKVSTTLGGTITQGLSEEALRLSLTNHIIIQ